MTGEVSNAGNAGLDWTIYGTKTPKQGEAMPGASSKERDDIGKISEVSNEELEQELPVWVVETNRFEKTLAMASLRSAVSGGRLPAGRPARSA